MRKCEYPNGSPIGHPDDVGEDRGIARLFPGLTLRALTFHQDREVIHALQLNYHEIVLWRRWLCDCADHLVKGGI